MSRRVMHHEKSKFRTPFGNNIDSTGAQVMVEHVTYWCGRKVEWLIENDPIPESEQKRLDAQKEKIIADPWPHCPKCMKARERAGKPLKPTAATKGSE